MFYAFPRLDRIAMADCSASAWVFCMNHASGDQRSLNIFVRDILAALSPHEAAIVGSHSDRIFAFPPSMEKAVAPEPLNLRTLQWAVLQLRNLLSFPSVIPDRVKTLLKHPRGRPITSSSSHQVVDFSLLLLKVETHLLHMWIRTRDGRSVVTSLSLPTTSAA